VLVVHDPADVPGGFGPSAVTIGKFDGVHAGHRAVIRRLLGIAADEGLASAVVTFDRHPAALLAPAARPQSLVSNRQKIELLAELGVDATLMLPFDERLQRLSPEEFVRTVLVDALRARVVLVGEDFRFGAQGAGDAATLTRLGESHGFRTVVVGDVMPDGSRKVSSTWIRDLMDRGDVEAAAELLGRAPAVRGVVVHGEKRGRELGFPTANLSPEAEGLIPADGVYAGWLRDGDRTYPSAISVGTNPTFAGVRPRVVEAFVLDETLDLYDHEVEVVFVARIRGMVAYEGREPLIAQMADDVMRTRGVLGI
jgi:riboflavin kinase/FMN adenylyltransferase